MTAVSLMSWAVASLLCAQETGAESDEGVKTEATESAPLHAASIAAPVEGMAFRESSSGRTSPEEDWTPIAPGAEIVLADLVGPGVVERLWFSVQCSDPHWQRRIVLRAFWDGEGTPSVEVPVGDFFAIGERLGGTLDTAVCRVAADGRAFTSTWPMPFQHSARLTLRNDSQYVVDACAYQIDGRTFDRPFTEPLRTFHAAYRQEERGNAGRFVLARIAGEGHYVGTVLSVVTGEDGWFGEGDEVILVDTPGGADEQGLRGTALDECFGSAWGLREETGRESGVTLAEGSFAGARATGYRWYLSDPKPFTRSLEVRFERRGYALRSEAVALVDDRTDRFSGVAFWYQVEPHVDLGHLPTIADRLAYAEQRVELENAMAELHCADPAVRLVEEEGPFWAHRGQVAVRATSQPQHGIVLPWTLREPVESVALRVTLGPAHGVWELWIDGAPISGPLDLHASAPRLEERVFPARLDMGEHRVELRCVGRSPSSVGYDAGLDSLAGRN